MGFFDTGLEKAAAMCLGAAAVTFGAPAAGITEAVVAGTALVGFVLGRKQKFGPENARIRAAMQKEVLANYKQFVSGGDGNHSAHGDLEAANDVLMQALESCVINRTALAEAAVSPEGFPGKAVSVIMEKLGDVHPEFFGTGKNGTLPYRFAEDVVRAGFEAAILNAEYYRALEPALMFEMANALGMVRADVADIKLTVQDIRDRFPEVAALQKQLNATESDLIALLTMIQQQHVRRENLDDAFAQSYKKLQELRENMGDMKSLANEAPEIQPLLQEADEALESGEHFSLQRAEDALAKADKRYAEIIEAREETVKRDKQNRARLLGKRAELAAVKFDYASATELYREQSKLLEAALGENHPDVAESYNDIAYNLNAQGRYDEAEAPFRKALKIRQTILGEAHPDTSISYNYLALNLDKQGHHDEAEPLLRKALKIAQAVLGELHPNTAACYNNLASNLDDQGRYDEAEPLYRKAQKIAQKVLNETHPDMATSYNNLASNLDNQGRYSEAEPFHRRALEISQDVFGELHPVTATSCNNLALSLHKQDRHDEAELLHRKALKIRQTILGETHPDTATSYNNLATNLDGQARYDKSEPLHRKALEIAQTVLGETHPDTATTHNNLASNLNAQGRHDEAEPLYHKALAILEKRLGPDHPKTKSVKNNLDKFLQATGRK